jgi:hypothetical protein
MISDYTEALLQWQGKPYYSLNQYLQEQFGEKVYKIAIDGGFTCPNRDGTLGNRGCIFCSGGGSGDFSGARLSGNRQIEAQLAAGKQLLSKKQCGQRFIAYFQAFTNTYAPVAYLESLYTPIIERPDIAVLSIATRPDCLSPEIIQLLKRLNQRKPVWIELGLQTIHEDTARLIRRGYPLEVFSEAVLRLHEAGIETIVHTILGLPGESSEDIRETHRFLARQPIQGIKLQLLHVLRETDLNTLYQTTPFHILSLEEYSNLVIDCMELLPPDMVIHRITGDGPKQLLEAPLWSGHKKHVLNTIHHTFKIRSTWQGRLYVPDTGCQPGKE